MNYYRKSYAQEGEDIILWRLFENKPKGFYVDVGAHHPQRFSNTYLFYKQGWSGINIDAMPGSMAEFQKMRPRDINLEMAIAEEEQDSTFFVFNDPALNTFDMHLAQEREKNTKYTILRKEQLFTQTLATVLDQHMPQRTIIDFMSIDAEGFDLQVLKSNDWQLYRPTYVLAESFASDLKTLENDQIYRYLDSLDYVLFAKTVKTLFFKDGSVDV